MAVTDDDVSGPFIGLKGLEEAKESIKYIAEGDIPPIRLVAELHPLTGLKRDPNVVGGQNQALGMKRDFNKFWENRNDINALMDKAQTYLDERGKKCIK